MLSPGTEARDRGEKARVYAREGVRHYWLVNPILHTLEVWRLSGDRWLVADVFHGQEEVNAEPFDAVPIRLGDLWMPEDEPEDEPGATPEGG